MSVPPVSDDRQSPRIKPGTRREVGTFTHLFAKVAGRVAGTNPPNLFLTLGRQRRMFPAWLWFAGSLMPGGRLSRRDSELAILRVAHLRDCQYEWEHHRRLGRRAGIGKADLERVTAGPAAEGWTPRQRALLTAVDELHHQQDLADATWAQLRTHFTQPECVEICMLAGHYEMLATTITALRIQPDRPAK